MIKDIENKRILIIEDLIDFSRILRKMLESTGARDIDVAAHAEDALNLLRKKSYDIVLCDYNLGEGEKDGQQILEEVNHNGLIKYSSIFIMVTAENTMYQVMGAVENQPDDYLIKPVTKDIMIKRIERLMKKKSDFADIEHAMQKKEYLRAISLCDEFRKTDKKNVLEYLRLKSEVYEILGRYDDAMAVYEEVLAMREIPWAQMGLGKIYLEKGAYLKAKDMFQSIIDNNKAYMTAYDWLAKTLQELGSLKEAQQILMTAAEISPKGILRQQAIGNISYKMEDYDTAEKSFKSAIEMGKKSCYKSASEYTGLAKLLLNKDSSEEALSVLADARKEFDGDREALVQTAVTEVIVYKESNREEEAKKVIEEASSLMESIADKVPLETAMDLAKVCLEMGDKEKGMKFIQTVVKNNHDNNEVIEKLEGVFKDVHMEEEGAKLIKSAKNEIIKLNNLGVSLIKEGKVEEAIEYFEKAAKALPENKIINANAAHAYIKYMKTKGTNDKYLYRTSQYLDRVHEVDPSFKKYQELLKMYEELVASNTNLDV